MTNLKNITDLPMAESAKGVNLIVNDNGVAKQIKAGYVGSDYDLIFEFSGRDDFWDPTVEELKPIPVSTLQEAMNKLRSGQFVKILWKHQYVQTDYNFCYEAPMSVLYTGYANEGLAMIKYMAEMEGTIEVQVRIRFNDQEILSIN